MSLRRVVRKLGLTLAGLAGALACSPTPEMPRLPPLPDPVPGAPDPIVPRLPTDAGVRRPPPPVAAPGFYATQEPSPDAPPDDAPLPPDDAGVDAFELPPLPDDWVPADAAVQRP